MCKFCDNLLSSQYFLIPKRSSMDIDNLCQILALGRVSADVEPFDDMDCHDCHGCDEKNTRFMMSRNENRVAMHYEFKAKGLQIAHYSYAVPLNFCPWCGKSLTDKPVPFEQVPFIKEIPHPYRKY